MTGGGPTGLVLDENRRQLFVLTRFDNSISIIDTQTRSEVAHVSMFNPEPPSVVQGRRFLYDATLSSHGDSACASCHVFGDNDDLSLGSRQSGRRRRSQTTTPSAFRFQPNPNPVLFPPMKGPMSTQSLRGMSNHGPMHWRGDRTGSNSSRMRSRTAARSTSGSDSCKFQKGFADLLGDAWSDSPTRAWRRSPTSSCR